MNGQTKRLELVEQLLMQCGISRIVETGTFTANTTVWFASFGLPVMTVEINPRYYGFARARLRSHHNVSVVEGNSIDFLKSLIAAPIDRTAPTLFYLDAHWLDYLPLRDEIELIIANFSDAVVVIDDFEVPDDPGYGFDNYGTDKRLSLDYLLQASTPPLAIYFPRARSEQESGARRGSVTLTANPRLEQILDRLPGLRRWTRTQQDEGTPVEDPIQNG
jgi:predicted O-methyltransferase YrrM